MTTADLLRVLAVKPQLCGKGLGFYREAMADLEEEVKEVLSDLRQFEAEMLDDEPFCTMNDLIGAEDYWHGRLLDLVGRVPNGLYQLAWGLTSLANIGYNQGQIRPDPSLGRYDLLYSLDATGQNPAAQLIAGVSGLDEVGEDESLFDILALCRSAALPMS